MAHSLLIAAVLLLASAVVFAHDPLTDGVSTGPAYSTWNTALTIPTNKKSLAARRISNCASPFFWTKYTGKKNDVLAVEAGTYGAAGLGNIKVSAIIFGSVFRRSSKKFAFPVPPKTGAKFVDGAKDVSTCSWLPKEKLTTQKVHTLGGVKRCGTLVKNVAESFFPLLSYRFVLPAAGTYHILFYTQGQYDGRWYIGSGSWKHVHADIKLPKPPKGNTGLTDDQFWDYKAKSKCCVKGVSVAKCPATKIYA